MAILASITFEQNALSQNDASKMFFCVSFCELYCKNVFYFCDFLVLNFILQLYEDNIVIVNFI